MKKLSYLLFVVLFLFLGFDAQAGHSLGGEIKYEHLYLNQYRVTLKFYHHCNYYSSIPGRNPKSVYWTNGIISGSASLPVTNIESLYGMGSCTTGNTILAITHSDILTLPHSAPNNTITISTQFLRTIGTISHLPPSNYTHYIETTIPNNGTTYNSSPVIHNYPLFRSCSNEAIAHHRPFVDPDGDSLVFSLVDPISAPNYPLPYAPGFSVTAPLGINNPVRIDSSDGTISFTSPTFTGNIGLSTKIEEYRNGVKIAESTHSHIYQIYSCTNSSPTLSGIDSTNTYTKTLCPNTLHCFNIYATDVDTGNIPKLVLSSAPPNVNLSSYWDTLTQTTVGQLCWTPTIADTGIHYIYIKARDSVFNGLITELTKRYEILVQNPNPPIHITASSNPTCEGDTIQLNCNTTATNIDSFSWSNNHVSNIIREPDSLQTNSVTNLSATYQAFVRYNDGCTSTKQIPIQVNSLPAVQLIADSASHCIGGSSPAQVINLAQGNHYSYGWRDLNSTQVGYPLFSTSFSPNLDTFQFTPYQTAGVYVFEGTTLDSSTGCMQSDTTYYEVVTPNSNCGGIYVSPTGTHTGTGSPNSPVSLSKALLLAQCGHITLKLAIGTYIINESIALVDGITIEGGFLPNKNWAKTSLAGATIIRRSNLNPEGTINIDQHLTAIEGINVNDFRLQDLTIEVDSAAGSSISTYGIFLYNTANYTIARVQIQSGNASDGTMGADGCGRTVVSYLDGILGTNGSNGVMGSSSVVVPGGNGGWTGTACGSSNLIFGGSGGTGNGAQGGQGTHAPNGPAGHPIQSLAPDGGAGGGGGAGGQANTAGGNGGNSGDGAAPFSPPNTGPSATISGVRGAAVLGGNGGTPRLPNGSPAANGTDGFDGIDGIRGRDGNPIPSPFSNPTSIRYVIHQSEYGEHGSSGSGGAGGGGGGGTFGGLPILPGTGNAGGGGGGGGAAGAGGEGGYDGGSSFGIYIHTSPNGSIKDCAIQTGMGGQGGSGGQGGIGGIGGAGGLGATADTSRSNPSYLAAGGNGGKGGDGGNGGNGGNGRNGLSQAIYTVGIAPSRLDSSFSLSTQPVIEVADINSINTDIEFLATTAPIGNSGVTQWDFDVQTNFATPGANTNNPSLTQYNQIGRYSIRNNTDVYTDFYHTNNSVFVSIDSLKNSSSLSSPNGSIKVEAVNGTAPYSYSWSNNANNSTNPTITNLSSDTYCVTITDATGCQKNRCIYIDYGIQYARSSSRQNFMMAPNPAGFSFRVFTQNLETDNISLHINNTLGQLVLEQPLTNEIQEISIQQLPVGLYWVTLKKNDILLGSQKLIITR